MDSSRPPEDLSRHADWVRRLAAARRRGDDPDDLAQETWLAALRNPPRDDVPARPWLAAVVRNLFRMRLRGERRRASRETEYAAAIEDAAPPTDVLLERLSAQQRLEGLVQALDEPYRSTVRLRYYDGRSAAEIARAQGVPAGTVRWRLKIGLDKLRAELDRESGPERERGRRALLWLTGGPGARRWLRRGGATGALLKALGAIAVAGLCLLAVWPRRAPPGDDRSAAADIHAAAAPARSLRRASAQATATFGTRASVTRDGAAAGTVEGSVIDWSTGLGIGGAELVFASGSAAIPVTADAAGRFRFEPAEEGRYALATASAPGYLPFAPEWGQSPIALVCRAGLRLHGASVRLVPAADIQGLVVDARGAPVAGASVTLLDAAQGDHALLPLPDRFTTDERGEIVFHAPPEAILEARREGAGTGRAALTPEAVTLRKLVIHLGPAGEAAALGAPIEGRVIDELGAPIAGALVRTDREDDAGLRPPAEALSDEAGHFTLKGLDPGAYKLAVSAAGRVAASFEGVHAGATGLMLPLRRGGVLAGRVVSAASGAPVPAFTLVVGKQHGLAFDLLAARLMLDGEGRFSMEGLAPGAYRVIATAEGFAPAPEVDAVVAAPGDAAASPLELALPAGGTITGRVLASEDGAPLAAAHVWVRWNIQGAPEAVPINATAVTGADGTFAVGGVPAGLRSITVSADERHTRLLSGLLVTEGGELGPINVALPARPEGEPARVRFGGIGAFFSGGEGVVIVEMVHAGGGAEEAGLAPGDGIVRLDGVPVSELGLEGFLEHSRSPEAGVPARLTIRRGNQGPESELLVPRRLLGPGP